VRPTPRRRLLLAATAVTGAAALVVTGLTSNPLTAAAGPPAGSSLPRAALNRLQPIQGLAKGGKNDALTAAQQLAQARTAPGLVDPGAYDAAFRDFQRLPSRGGNWTESTDVPYDSDDLRYRDPAGNSTGGLGIVSGRIVALAASPDGDTLYAGAANGGVFRSNDKGTTWDPITDRLPSLSVGDVAVAPDGAVWLATGEANTGATSYAGSGVYRLGQKGKGHSRGKGAQFKPKNRVGDDRRHKGGNPLSGTTINKLHFDGAGSVYAATSRGLWKASDKGGPWTRVLLTNPAALNDPTNSNAPYANIVNDVVTRPGQPGTVLAAVGWRSSTNNSYYGNGFYISTNSGKAGSFTKTQPTGINGEDIGNTTFSYAKDGSALYAVVQSLALIANPRSNTVLMGVYVSSSGSPKGPWTLVANSPILEKSGSALDSAIGGVGYQPGIQAWYNQFLAVDPADPKHVYLGLEEVYETRDGGRTWKAVGPYWNFYFPCWSVDPSSNTCPATTHPDQHDVVFAGNGVYVGNDGGVYGRSAKSTAVNANNNATDWKNYNADLRSLQYYSAQAGKDRQYGGVTLSGGLQDNGGSVLRGLRPDGRNSDPGDGVRFPATTSRSNGMGSNFGGDGGDTLVDPANGCNIVGEYVYLSMRKTTTPCGQSDGHSNGTADIAPPDNSPRFIAPFEADSTNSNHWFAGGNSVWFNDKGFAIPANTKDTTGWVEAANLGANPVSGALFSTTTVASAHDVAYAGYCGTCNNKGFTRGLVRIEPKAGGGFTKTELAASGLPNRYLSGIWVDPARTSHVVVGVNGFSRKWTEGPGAGTGHVFESVDGGETFKDISGNLPDVPVDDVEVVGGTIVLGTDLGVVAAERKKAGTPLRWSTLGRNLPAVTVMDVSTGPDGVLYAGTHSRGIWGYRIR